MDVLRSQYGMIKRTRESLFKFCEKMSPEDYAKEVEALGGTSIRNLHVHVADCYRVWLGTRTLGKSISKIKPESITNVLQMRELFKGTDALVDEFLNEFRNQWDPTIQAGWQSESVELTELWLFTHCITHEFHHRGQIVKLGRQLGYIPNKMNLSKL